MAVTTGTNTWAQGLDVVVEGTTTQITDNAELQRIADAYVAKYGEVWRFTVGDGVFDDDTGGPAAVSASTRQGDGLREGTARPDDVRVMKTS